MGWDIERFPEGEVNLELICCICTCILEDPVESPCRHVFCSKCIRTWLVNQKSCPHCRATVHRRDLKSVVPLLKNIISKQRIFCDYKEMGCTELIPLENLESHTQVCQYSLVACSNAGCTTKVLRKDHKTHAEVCAKRMVMCEQGCEMLLTLGDRSSHNCIRALYSHFQGVTNELLGRIAKLEEQVNVLTSKNHGNSNNYGQVPYSIPSPHNYTTFPEIHPDNNLTSYPVDAATDGGATSAEEDEGEEDFTADQAYQDRNDFVVRPAVHHQNNRRGGQRNRGNHVNHTSPVNMSPVYDNSSPAVSPLHHRISSPRSNNRSALSPRYRSRSPQPVLLRIGLQPSAANSSTSSSASSSSNESEISD